MAEEQERKISLDEAAGIAYLSPETASFRESGEFIGATLGEAEYGRVWVRRAFPFDAPEEFISVQNKDGEELGLIRRLEDFDADTAVLIRRELERAYFMPKIQEILSLRERRGFSYWRVRTDTGELDMTVQDTYKSITRIGEDRAIVCDAAGNRFEIESLIALDRHSRRRIELYL